MSAEVTAFKLHLESVEQVDMGPYLCQLSTEYKTEETQQAWIKVDYRRGMYIYLMSALAVSIYIVMEK